MVLPLQNARGEWIEGEDWQILDQEGNKLFEVKALLSPQEVMNIIRFARAFEQKAFNQGKEEGIQAAMAAGKLKLNELILRIKFLEKQNESLSLNLQRHIIGE